MVKILKACILYPQSEGRGLAEAPPTMAQPCPALPAEGSPALNLVLTSAVLASYPDGRGAVSLDTPAPCFPHFDALCRWCQINLPQLNFFFFHSRACILRYFRVAANSRRQWRTEEPGRQQSMGLQRVQHDLTTEQQRQACYCCISSSSSAVAAT